MKLKTKPKYITNEKGKKTSVIISLHEYEHLIETLEDLEDACDLFKAEREATGFIPYDTFRKKLLAEK